MTFIIDKVKIIHDKMMKKTCENNFSFKFLECPKCYDHSFYISYSINLFLRLICYIKYLLHINFDYKMLERKASKSIKESSTVQNETKGGLASDDPRTRVLQYQLVFVTGLPSSVASKEVLNKELFFGRYGRVLKTILNPSYPFKKGTVYQAYATYDNELDASLAIVALDGFNLGDRPMKVSYGTTKYCSYFLKGKQCTNSQCFYLHHIQKEREVVSGDTRTIFREQNDRAFDIVINNLQTVVERILDSKIEQIEDGFPSLTEMIDFMIESDYLSQKQFDSMVEKVKRKRANKGSNCSSKNQRKESMAQSSTLSNKIDLRQQKSQIHTKQQFPTPKDDSGSTIQDLPRLIKSNSFSTMASPNKPQNSTQFDEQQKPAMTQISHEPISLTVRSQDQNKKCYQNIDFEEKLEEKISQKIIKQILKKEGIKSKFDFVKADMKKAETVQEAKKVKNIIQRFLITYQ